ncbi:MAG: phage tail tip lysozyme [Patescibacteria group bacterium]|mgnify:CR=1 FL=1
MTRAKIILYRLFVVMCLSVMLPVQMASQPVSAVSQNDIDCAKAGGISGTCAYQKCSVAGASDSNGDSISGDLKTLAQQILDSSKISFDYGPNGDTGKQFKRLAAGQKAQTDTGREVDVQPIILITILHISQSHKVNISALTDGSSHTAPTNPHGSGKGVDINILDGSHNNGSDAVAYKIINSAAEVLPAGSRFGMGNGPFGSKTISGKKFTSFVDAPNHVHIDVLGVSQADIDKAVQAAGGSGGGTAGADTTTYTYKAEGIIPKSGKTVVASTFGGEYTGGKWKATNDKQNPGGKGNGNDDNGAGNTPTGIVGHAGFAELSVNVGSGDYSALGGLPAHTKLQITYKGKSVIAEKLDVGAGGDAHPLIDLWWETAKLLDFTTGNGKVKLRVVPDSTPTTPVDGSATDTGDSEDDAATGCCPVDQAEDTDGTSLVGKTKAEKAFNYFVGQHSLSPKVAAGIVGNMMTESGGQTEELDTHAHNDISGTHDGIVQWSTSRWAGLKAHEKGKNPYSLTTQLDYVWYELDEGGYKSVLKNMKSASSAAGAATIFNSQYEVSGDNSGHRESNATKLFTKYGGGASPATVDGSEDGSDSGSACPSGDGSDDGSANMKRAIRVTSKGKFITLPSKYSCPGRTTRIDSRIAADIAYLVNHYDMCADDGLADGHKSHGAGLGVDMRPKSGNSKQTWKETVEQAARDMGWYGDGASDSKGSKSGCASYSGYGSCGYAGHSDKFAKWVRWIGYNGDVDHGDPWHVFGGSYAHIHIGWDTPNHDGAAPSIIASPRASVYAFPAPVPDDLESLVD